MMKYKKGLCLFIFIVLLLFFVIQFIYVVSLPRLVNINSHKNEICEFFKNKTGKTLKIGAIDFKTYKNFSFSVSSDFIDIENEREQNIYHSNFTFIKIQPLAIITKKLKIDSLKTKDISVDISDFQDFLHSKKDKSLKFPLKIDLKNAFIDINEYKIIYKDKNLKKNLVLQGKDFLIKPLSKNLSKFQTEGILGIDNKICSFDINSTGKFLIKDEFDLEGYSANGNISNVDLSLIAPYLNEFSSYKNAKGLINISFSSNKKSQKETISDINIKINDLSINEEDNQKRILAKGLTEIKLELSANKKILNIKDFNIFNNNFKINTTGTITDYNKDKPNFDLILNLNQIQADKVIDLLPYGILNEIDILKTQGVKGIINGKININGKLPNIKLYGDLDAKKVHAIRDFYKTHEGDIKVNFVGRKIDLSVFVETANKARFYLTGEADIDPTIDSYFDLHTENGELPLPMVKAILVPVSQLCQFEIGPVPFFDITEGLGSAKLHIQGTRKLGSLTGYVALKKGKATFEGINSQLDNINLLLNFKDKDIEFKTITATADYNPVSVYGNCDLFGKIQLHIDSKKMDMNIAKNIITTSPFLKDFANSLNIIEKAQNYAKIELFFYGQVDPFSKNLVQEFNKLKIKGNILLNRVSLLIKGFDIPIKEIYGRIDLSDFDVTADNLKIKYGNSSAFATIKGKIDKNIDKTEMDISLKGNNISLSDSVNFILKSDFGRNSGYSIPTIPEIHTKHSMQLNLKIKGREVDYKSINGMIKIWYSQPNKFLLIPTGEILIKDGNVKISDLSVKADKSKLYINGLINNFYAKYPAYQLDIQGSNLLVKSFTDLLNIYPTNIKNLISMCKNYKGSFNLNIKLTQNGINGFINFKDLSFKEKTNDIPIYLKFLPVKFTNHSITIDKITGQIGNPTSFPFMINCIVENYMKIPVIKGSFAFKPNEQFVENYINTKLTQPIKLSGDVGITTEFDGSVDALGIYPTISIYKDSDISYLTSNLGDTDCLRKISGSIILKKKSLLIKNLDCIKYPIAQNNKKYAMPLWVVKGTFDIEKKNLIPKNVSFVTYKKIPAKILNFVFKKSLIKSGDFTCSLSYNENGKNPKLIGTADIYNAEIPLYNIKVNQGSMVADGKTIKIKSDGDLIATKYNLYSEIENSLTLPAKIKNININVQTLNLSNILDCINKWSIDVYTNTTLKTKIPNISNVIIEKGTFLVKSIHFKNCPLENFSSEFSLNKNAIVKFKINNLKMAGGTLNGHLSYNFANGKTDCETKMRSVDSNIVTNAFFGMKNQITGKLDGNIKFTTHGVSDIEKIKNSNGIFGFHMENGSIPKLGSVEYLLRASTLLHTGLTSLSVNNLIELLKPFKTGNFSKISGCLYLKNGILKDIAVFSQGTNLSIYLTGDYNITESEAHNVVYGKLGKKTEGLLGPIGNISASTLFSMIPRTEGVSSYEKEISKIPDIEYKNQEVRIFRATVDGDINLDKVNTSFKWIK